jgi:hypothetical protein
VCVCVPRGEDASELSRLGGATSVSSAYAERSRKRYAHAKPFGGAADEL